MQKFVCACGLMVAACVMAGLYGMIHNQISYTVAPEYFTQFKFDQFSVPPSQQNRWGASLVGWQAAWWMGIVIGGLLIPLGLVIPGWQQYLRTMGQTFLVVMGTTLAVGVSALLYAYVAFTPTSVLLDHYPARITQPLAFERAGHMHNFSYLGGFVGIVVGIIFLLVQRKRLKRRATQPELLAQI